MLIDFEYYHNYIFYWKGKKADEEFNTIISYGYFIEMGRKQVKHLISMHYIWKNVFATDYRKPNNY